MKNELLRRERLRKGWSQQQLADFAVVSLSTVARAERGEAIRVDSIQRLCMCLSKIPEDLGLLKVSDDKSGGISMRDEESTPEDVGSQNNLILPFTIDPGMTDRLDDAESIISLAWEAWFASRPREAARSVNKLLPGLERIVYAPHVPVHTLRAKELAIRAHGLLGSVCLDALQNDQALFHYMQAQKFSEEIHNIDLASTYLCLVGDVLRRQNDKSGALRNMESARDRASSASNVTLGHILQLLAYTYGDTGQEEAFERTISEATDLLAFSGEGLDSAQKEFIPFEIYEIRGKVNRDLGKPLHAIPYLELAEKSLATATADSVTPRWRALLEISRAQAFCDAGDITTGIDLACKGFLMAYQCRSPRQMNRVRKLLKKLESGQFKDHPRVHDLKNLVYETYLVMDNEDPSKPNRGIPLAIQTLGGLRRDPGQG